MAEPATSRRILGTIAANLRTLAATAKNNAALADIDDTGEAEHWGGRADGLMDAHELVVARLAEGRIEGDAS